MEEGWKTSGGGARSYPGMCPGRGEWVEPDGATSALPMAGPEELPLSAHQNIYEEIQKIYSGKAEKKRFSLSFLGGAQRPAAEELGLKKFCFLSSIDPKALKSSNYPLLGLLYGVPLSPSQHAKARVMVMGNHSSGKSTFVNWLVGEEVQTTGVAIETAGFTFVTSGEKRADLGGESTSLLFPFLPALVTSHPPLSRLLCTKVRPGSSRLQKVDLIDTPGLADGALEYSVDICQCLQEMADFMDIILIFLDPIGQALCNRTMSVLEHLSNSASASKIIFCLSKIDSVYSEKDKIKVANQVAQLMTRRLGAQHGFDLLPIFVPGAAEGSYLSPQSSSSSPPSSPFSSWQEGELIQKMKVPVESYKNKSAKKRMSKKTASGGVNRVEEVLARIEGCGDAKVQAALDALKSDTEKVKQAVKKELKEENRIALENRKRWERERNLRRKEKISGFP